MRAPISVVVAAAIGLSLVGAGAARAQLVPCHGIAEPGFKILLDDIVTGGGGEVSPLMRPLIHRLDANLEQLKLETGLALTVVRCEKRQPSDPTEFRREIVQQLNAHQVVLEIWGMAAEVVDAGTTFHEASIGYALIPVRFYEFNAPQPPGAFEVAQRAASVSNVDALVQLVDRASQVAAYTALSAGTRLMRTKDFLSARRHLCRAQVLLGATSPRPGSPDAMLHRYATRLAAEALDQARAASPAVAELLAAGTTPSCEVTP